MEILKESKENLPVAFITSFVSDGWEKVGILKEEIEAIKKEFKGTKKVEELIQALIDAYLVCIGQLEQHLADKDYLDFEPAEVKEKLKEDVNINIEEVKVIKPEIDTHSTDDPNIILNNKEEDEIRSEMPVPQFVKDEIEHCEECDEDCNKSATDKLADIEEACKNCEEKDETEKFEYFVDEFPEPIKEEKPDEE